MRPVVGVDLDLPQLANDTILEIESPRTEATTESMAKIYHFTRTSESDDSQGTSLTKPLGSLES